MFKKFLCVFAMALLFVACDGKSDKKSSDDEDEDVKTEFNTGNDVFDEGLQKLNIVCQKVKYVESIDELDELESGFKRVAEIWTYENIEVLDSLYETKAYYKFRGEIEQMWDIFHDKRNSLEREESRYECDSIASYEAPVKAAEYYDESYYYADTMMPAEAPVEATEYYDEPYYY